eukprot:TRINITY_DN32927_c0_g1_i1.p1 TRINITY_DN32927_c0_g1~~TRINITY_DN32927_c0_g1_i1.p1  ORF type:complete len:327 (+),score=5.53 TRINITY_DN32927_c0_g1_i1:311-1291(+)
MKADLRFSGVAAILAIVFLISFAGTTDAAGASNATRKKHGCVKTFAECKGLPVEKCCNKTLTEIFEDGDFEQLFPNIGAPTAHAPGFWDYHSFILAAKNFSFEKFGFASVAGEMTQRKELAAFFAHVATDTSCAQLMAKSTSAGENARFQWGLCYNQELSPDSSNTYCQESLVYPCAPGASYYGRGALPVYWNFNYGMIGEGLKVDLLNNPDLVSTNATLGFASALWKWMTPVRPKQPSAHDVMVGKWKPTKNDTLEGRKPGFGMTINILQSDMECGPNGDQKKMGDRVDQYLYFLDLLKVGRDNSGENLYCTDQKPLNPTTTSSS